jgi:hypothetical protein
MGVEIVISSGISSLVPSGANELHIGRLNIESIPIIVVSICPFFDPKAAFNVHRPALRKVLRRVLCLIAPKGNFEPSGYILEFPCLIPPFFVGSH